MTASPIVPSPVLVAELPWDSLMFILLRRKVIQTGNCEENSFDNSGDCGVVAIGIRLLVLQGFFIFRFFFIFLMLEDCF